MRFFIAFTFYLRNMGSDIREIIQSFLQIFVTSNQYTLFDIYFNTLVEIIDILAKPSPPTGLTKLEASSGSAEVSFSSDVLVRVDLGFKLNISMKINHEELFLVLLNLLQVFPASDVFDKIKQSSFVSITTYVEGYIKRLMRLFGGGSEKLANSTFYTPSILKMRDLVFFTQEPVKLLIKKHEFRYCYMGLLCQLAISSADKIIQARELLLQCYSILQTKHFSEADTQSIGSFLGPFVQVTFDCWGLIIPEMIVQTNIAVARHMQRTRRSTNDLVFSFLNLIKSNYVCQIEKVSKFYPAPRNLGEYSLL